MSLDSIAIQWRFFSLLVFLAINDVVLFTNALELNKYRWKGQLMIYVQHTEQEYKLSNGTSIKVC